jgi:AmmeMemoRadiSam system protein A
MVTERGPILLKLARGAIADALGEPEAEVEHADWLREPGATFVTLTRHSELRGCIGSLVAERPLREDVTGNARAAAFRDPRFAPLTRTDYREIAVEVSLLSAMTPIEFESEEHLLTQLRPGVDGLVLEHGWQRGTFLPQVWDQLPEPRAFLGHLNHTAGLAADFWAGDIRISRYTVTKWCEGK